MIGGAAGLALMTTGGIVGGNAPGRLIVGNKRCRRGSVPFCRRGHAVDIGMGSFGGKRKAVVALGTFVGGSDGLHL